MVEDSQTPNTELQPSPSKLPATSECNLPGKLSELVNKLKLLQRGERAM